MKPGEDEAVRVVFNNRLREGDTTAGEGDPDSDEWKKERAKRFRVAPKPRPLEEIERPSQVVPISAPSTGLVGGVVIRALDKMTGKTLTHEMAVGELRQIERLRIRPDGSARPGMVTVTGRSHS